VDGLWSNL